MTDTTGITRLYRRDNQPFAQIPNAAIRNPNLTANGFRLLAYLMSHQDGYELTYSQIERETGLGRHAINGAIKNLKENGWLESERTKLANGQFGPKSWTVLTPTSVNNSTAGDSTVEQPTDIKKTTNKEQQDKEQVNPQTSFEDDFLKFWKLYPRKMEKIAARAAFDKAAKKFGPLVILAGVDRLACDPNLPDKAFIPYPATWLNAGGWGDEPYPERKLSAEEVKERNRIARERKAAKESEERELARAERERLRLEAEANKPEVCEHDRVKVICPTCSPLKVSKSK